MLIQTYEKNHWLTLNLIIKTIYKDIKTDNLYFSYDTN